MTYLNLAEIINMISENWESVATPESEYDRFDVFRFIPEFVEK